MSNLVQGTVLGVSQVRQPRGLVQVNGITIPGWLELDIESNTFREADTFRITYALGALPDANNDVWFCSQGTLSVVIYTGFPTDPANYGVADLDLMLSGHVDQLDYDPTARTLVLSGRDLTSLFIDSRTAEKWINQTSSQIAQTLATRHGLTAVVTPTQTPVGRFYQIDHIVSTVAQTEWDLLCWLAQQEGYVVYVQGSTLYFQPPPAADTAPQYPVYFQPATGDQPFQSNTARLAFQRTLTVGKTITVQVRSWNQRQAKAFNEFFPSSKGSKIKPGTATAPAQLYSYRIPNLSQAQAIQRAEAIYNELIQNEMRVSIDMPADNVLTKTSVMPLTGTGTAFDQTYYPQSIQRRLSMSEGYRMTIEARNHSEALQPAVETT